MREEKVGDDGSDTTDMRGCSRREGGEEEDSAMCTLVRDRATGKPTCSGI